MSTTSPNFGLIIATTTDTVSVTSHIANNFSTVDALIGVCHTGTGALKAGLTLTTPVLVNPTFSGTASSALLVASTGLFNTITSTAGVVTLTTLNVGTYSIPSTIGNTGQLLTVSGGNAVWIDNVPATGAAEDLSNLASVAINTSLGTFSASKVTVAQIIATSGTLSGLTSIVATTGTYSVNLTVVGTLNAGAVNCTGGAITAAGLAIGTYSLPATVGSAGQHMVVSSGNVIFSSGVNNPGPVVFEWHGGHKEANSNLYGQMTHSVTGFPSGADITGEALFSTWAVAQGGGTASQGLPLFYSTFYKFPNVNTLGWYCQGSILGTAGEANATGHVLVYIGTANADITLPGSGWDNFTTATGFSGVMNVSTLPNNTAYTMTISIAGVNSRVGYGSFFILSDIVGFVIT